MEQGYARVLTLNGGPPDFKMKTMERILWRYDRYDNQGIYMNVWGQLTTKKNIERVKCIL